MKITMQYLQKRRAAERRTRLFAGASLALAYAAVVVVPFTLLWA